MEITIILVDLDLTLLRSDATISQRTINTLKKCQEKGILVGFNTSRGLTRIEEYKKLMNPDILILNAGASIYYKDQLIHTEEFSTEEAQALFNKTYEVCGQDAEITVDTLNDFYWNKKENKSSQYFPESKYDDLKNFGQPAMKFCVQTNDETKAQAIIKDFPNCSAVLFSDIPWYKFSPKTASKEHGVQFLSEYLNIPTANMISFGDDFSDIGMLQATGIGVAMGNAIPQVKAIATAQTLSCDEDGVADFLEKNILN